MFTAGLQKVWLLAITIPEQTALNKGLTKASIWLSLLLALSEYIYANQALFIVTFHFPVVLAVRANAMSADNTPRLCPIQIPRSWGFAGFGIFIYTWVLRQIVKLR